jgi:DNA replication licensing factor MCM4
VELAVQLVRVAMQQAATDPETGLIDMDAILIGKTAKSKERVNRIKSAIEAILKANTHTFKKTSAVDTLMTEIERTWKKDDDPLQEKEIVEALRVLETEGIVTIFGSSSMRPNFKLANS